MENFDKSRKDPRIGLLKDGDRPSVVALFRTTEGGISAVHFNHVITGRAASWQRRSIARVRPVYIQMPVVIATGKRSATLLAFPASKSLSWRAHSDRWRLEFPLCCLSCRSRTLYDAPIADGALVLDAAEIPNRGYRCLRQAAWKERKIASYCLTTLSPSGSPVDS